MPNTITPAQFVKKWSQIQLKEQSASQSHFNDICALIGHKTPSEIDPKGEFFTFEADAEKLEGKRGRADAFYKNKFIWEYKGPHGNLDAAYQQLLLYKDSLGNPPLLITSDLQTIYIHTNFTNTVKKIYPVTFDTLSDGSGLELLRLAFSDPEKLRPEQTQEQVTKATANDFVEVADKLRNYTAGKNIPPEQLAHFLVRLLFCLFAEDIKLLPNDIFTKLIRANLNATQFEQSLRMLFAAMRTGGIFGVEPILHFNGGLFDNDFVPDQVYGEIVGPLRSASQHDWSGIDPSIFGTLFERIIDENKRKQLGAHYTSKDDILLVIEPVLMQPLRDKWQDVCMKAESAVHAQKNDEAFLLLKVFSDELANMRVLDPACGSGNFLYLALRQLLDLQKEVITRAARLGLPEIELSVDPHQIYGIEINPYAHELAQITVWIGYLQWRVENGFAYMEEPILKPLKQIENKDAIINTADGTEPDWPTVDIVIGNPPFLGSQKLRSELGDEYIGNLFEVYKDRLPSCDLVCYWFEKARAQIEVGKLRRAGLLATNSIRGGANRTVLERIKETGDIFWAISDHEWILDGAAVNVSMVGFDAGIQREHLLDGMIVLQINPNLTSTSNLTQAKRLVENSNICFQGPVKVGPFDIDNETAVKMLLSKNISGSENTNVIKPWLNGTDITGRPRNMWIIDFGEMSEDEASTFTSPFEYVKKTIKPLRDQNRDQQRKEAWWRLGRSGGDLKRAKTNLSRIMITSRVAKYRMFIWAKSEVVPDSAVVAITLSNDYSFGILQSRPHEIWALKQGTSLEDRPRYTPTTTFETYPFPWPPGQEPQEDGRVQAIAAAAKQLDDFRTEWLNPTGPYWSDATGRKKLKNRTLTNLYNALSLYRLQVKGKQRDLGAWSNSLSGPIVSLEDAEMLDHIHTSLDHTVLDAYGWPHNLSDEQILEHLLALNLERAG